MQMGKTEVPQTSQRRRTISAALEGVPDLTAMRARQTEKIREIRSALIAAGCRGLGAQAAALGLARSTAWTVLKGNHKGSGLSATVINRMLLSPQLPEGVRRVLEQYIELKCSGAFGHDCTKLRAFRARLKIAGN
jgi:hypothetical protein